jgi:fatty-acyl-CoA synthase
MARNSLSHVLLFYACARIGAVFQPLNWRLTGTELTGLIADARPEILVVQSEFASAAAQSQSRHAAHTVLEIGPGGDALQAVIDGRPRSPVLATDPDAASLLLYTSGATGRPKGVIVTPKSAFFGAYNNRVTTELTQDSVMLCDAPMFHVIGLIANMHAVFHAGGRMLIADRFDPAATLRLIGAADHPVTHYFCVPQMIETLRNQSSYGATDLSRLRAFFTGGAPMPPGLVEAYADDGVLALNNYGLTESTGGVFTSPLDMASLRAKPGSCGVACPAIEVRLVRPDGRDAAIGEVGEIWIKGPSVTPGYWNQPEATAAAFVDGWFRTGDAATRDEEGFYWIVDRWKDMYISGGENVYPAEVEAVLRQAPGVADAAVVGMPHPRWGEVGLAFVVRVEGAACDEAALIGFCGERLAGFKRPSAVRFVTELPRTASGKLQKSLLRGPLADEGKA